MHGSHAVKHSSQTQSAVSLSSGEAELRGIGDGLAQDIGLQSIARNMGLHWCIDLYTDATAAIGIARQKGMGRIRHLGVAGLWVQDKLNHKLAFLHKVLGAENPADLLTKYTDKALLTMALGKMGMRLMDDRSVVAPAAMGASANANA